MYTLLTDCWNEWEYDTEYAIRAENAICGTRGYSCIKAVSIEYGSKTVRLGRGHAVTLDGDIISSFPHLISDIYIDVATESSSVVSTTVHLQGRGKGEERGRKGGGLAGNMCALLLGLTVPSMKYKEEMDQSDTIGKVHLGNNISSDVKRESRCGI